MPQRIKAVLNEKGVQLGTSKVYLIKWPVSVCIYIYIIVTAFNNILIICCIFDLNNCVVYSMCPYISIVNI